MDRGNFHPTRFTRVRTFRPEKVMNLGIVSYLLLRVLPVSLLAMLVFWFVGAGLMEKTIRVDLEDRIHVVGQQWAASARRKLEGVLDVARSLAENDLIVNGLIDAEGRERYLPQFFRSLRTPGIAGGRISMIDFRGRTIVSNDPTNEPSENLRSVHVAPGAEILELSVEELEVSAPILYSGLPEGAVVLRYDPDVFGTIFGPDSRVGATFVLTADGTVLYSSDPNLATAGQPDPGMQLKHWVQVRSPIDLVPGMTLVAAAPVDQAYVLVDRLKYLQAFGLFVFIVIGAVIAALAAFTVRNRLVHLTSDVSRIEDTGDLSLRADLSGPLEIRRLATAFNEMVGRLDDVVQSDRQRAYFIEKVLRSAPAPIIVHRDDLVTEVNRAFVQTFGMEKDAVVGQPISSVLGSVGFPHPLIESVTDRQSFSNVETEVLREANDAHHFIVSHTVVDRDEDDLGREFLLLLQDMTWRRQVEQENARLEHDLKEAQKLEAIGVLAGGIAHEINTPAQYVGDNLRFLSEAHGEMGEVLDRYGVLAEAMRASGQYRQELEEIASVCARADLAYLREEVPQAVGQAIEGVEQISRIVLAMKDFSHPGTRQKVEVDINAAIVNTLTISRGQWKNIAEVDTDLDASLFAVPCYPGELNQVFLNLVLNAAHAIEAAGKDGRRSDQGNDTPRRWRGGGLHFRQRLRDSGGDPSQDLRAVLHDEGGREGNGSGACHCPRHHRQQAWWQDLGPVGER
jgi:signal transduction histidine kinase